jgi:hypothetical protein
MMRYMRIFVGLIVAAASVMPTAGEDAAKAARLAMDMLNYEQAVVQFDKDRG